MKRMIEKEITKLLKELKPEFKELVYTTDNKLKINTKNETILATCSYMTEPKVINFHLGSIEKLFRERLKEIIRHEIVHDFTTSEKEAYAKQKDFQVFQN